MSRATRRGLDVLTARIVRRRISSMPLERLQRTNALRSFLASVASAIQRKDARLLRPLLPTVRLHFSVATFILRTGLSFVSTLYRCWDF
jgi:hypothetical protein